MTTNRTNLQKNAHNRRTVQACLMLVPFSNRRKWEIWKLGGGKNWRLWNWNFQFYDLLEELYIEIGRPKKGIPVGVRALEAWWLRFIWFDALLKSHESSKELKRLTFPPMFSFILDGGRPISMIWVLIPLYVPHHFHPLAVSSIVQIQSSWRFHRPSVISGSGLKDAENSTDGKMGL